jgi:glutamyl-tRNA synthetase
MEIENLNEKIKAYALKNAIAYKGKPNPGSIVSALFNEGLDKSEVKEIMPKIQNIIKEISELSVEKMQKEFNKLEGFASKRKEREGLPEIPNTENGVFTRFAPSPSGAMHIGHALTASIAYNYVKEFGGKMILRIEDTNADNIYPKAYDLLTQDGNWLFEGNCEVVIQSDRMNLYYEYAKKLINLDAAYVCTCEAEKFKNISIKKEECPCRKLEKEKNLERWKKMLDENGYVPGEAVLRFKTQEKYQGMKNPNPAMRDFPLARINTTTHPRQGDKYRVWPLMNLSVSTDDIEMGLTHIIRAKEHMDNAKRQKMIFEVLGKEYPWNAYLGRWHIQGLRLSASEITKSIDEGLYTGWDDPELPTLQALAKRGYKPQAFHRMAEERGLSEVDKRLTKEEFFVLLDKYNKN